MNNLADKLSNKLQDLSDFWNTHTAPMAQVELGSAPEVDVAMIDPTRVKFYLQVINRLPKFKQILKEYNLGSNTRSSWYSAIRDINNKGKYINTLPDYRQSRIKKGINAKLKQNPFTEQFAYGPDSPSGPFKLDQRTSTEKAAAPAPAPSPSPAPALERRGGAPIGNFFSDKSADLKDINTKINKSDDTAAYNKTNLVSTPAKKDAEATKAYEELLRQKDSILDSIIEHPIYGPKEQKTTTTDIAIFCALTYIIRGISLYLVDWALSTSMVSTLTETFFFYIVIYWIIFGLICLVVNTNIDSNNGSFANPFKAIFYYLNTDVNSSMRIWAHLLIQIILFPIIIFITDGSEDPDKNSYKKQKSILFLVSNLSLLMWFLSAIIAFRI